MKLSNRPDQDILDQMVALWQRYEAVRVAMAYRALDEEMKRRHGRGMARKLLNDKLHSLHIDPALQPPHRTTEEE